MTNDNEHIIKETLGFQKTLFDNAYDLWIKYQDNTYDLMTHTVLDRYVTVPEEWRREAGKWTDNLKEGRLRFKKFVDEGFKKVGDIVSH